MRVASKRVAPLADAEDRLDHLALEEPAGLWIGQPAGQRLENGSVCLQSLLDDRDASWAAVMLCVASSRMPRLTASCANRLRSSKLSLPSASRNLSSDQVGWATHSKRGYSPACLAKALKPSWSRRPLASIAPGRRCSPGCRAPSWPPPWSDLASEGKAEEDFLEDLHDVGPAHDAGDRETVAHGLAEAGKVWRDTVAFLSAAQAKVKAGANLVEDQQGPMRGG